MGKTVLALLAAFVLLFQLSANDHWFAQQFSEKLINKQGETTDASPRLKGKMVAVYFFASWSQQCRTFTPELVKFYNSTARKNNVEVIFISYDRNSTAMMQYMRNASVPCPAIPFDSENNLKIRQKFGVSGIPRLMVFDKDGKIISRNARWDVMTLGAQAVNAWSKTNYTPLTWQDYNKRKTRSQAGDQPQRNANSAFRVDASTWQAGPSSEWHISLDTAFIAAKKENKKIYILTTGSDWCSWCRVLYRRVLDTDRFKKFAKENLILVYLDFPHSKQPESQRLYNEAVIKPLRIYKGAPAAFILDSDGRLLGRIGGYRDLDKYMPEVQKLVNNRPRRGAAVPPQWVKLPPEKLADKLHELKNTKLNNAKKARSKTYAAKQQMKFQIVAWGFDKNNVNTPFSPTQEIRVPLRKKVYFKVRYHLPPGINSQIWLQAKTSYCCSPSGGKRGQGEFTGLLAARKDARENQLIIRIRLLMPDSREIVAATLPCNIVWGNP